MVRIPAWCLEVQRVREALAVLRAHGWDRVRIFDDQGDGVLVRLKGSAGELLSVLQQLPGTTPGRERLLERLRAEKLATPS